MDLQHFSIQVTKRTVKLPFYCEGRIRDHDSGQPVFDDARYCGQVLVGRSVFSTGIDAQTGERFWRCI